MDFVCTLLNKLCVRLSREICHSCMFNRLRWGAGWGAGRQQARQGARLLALGPPPWPPLAFVKISRSQPCYVITCFHPTRGRRCAHWLLHRGAPLALHAALTGSVGRVDGGSQVLCNMHDWQQHKPAQPTLASYISRAPCAAPCQRRPKSTLGEGRRSPPGRAAVELPQQRGPVHFACWLTHKAVERYICTEPSQAGSSTSNRSSTNQSINE